MIELDKSSLEKISLKLVGLASGIKIFLLNMKSSLFLLIAWGLIYLVNLYWFAPQLQELMEQKSAIFIRKTVKMEELSASGIIEILLSFAQVDNTYLWVHKIKIEGNNINLKIRSNDSQLAEEYISKVARIASLRVDNIITKSQKERAKIEEEKEEEEEKPKIPFGARLFLGMDANIGGGESGDDNNENEKKEQDKLDELVFLYETEANLFASGR